MLFFHPRLGLPSDLLPSCFPTNFLTILISSSSTVRFHCLQIAWAVKVNTKFSVKDFVFWDITLCSPLKINRRFGETCVQAKEETSIKQVASRALIPVGLFFDTEMKMTCSFETSVEFQWTKRRYIPDDGTLLDHRCENHNSCTSCRFWHSRYGSAGYLPFKAHW
jgi:hypothetical protein